MSNSNSLAQEILSKRAEFLKHLNTDLTKHEEIIANTSKSIEELKQTVTHIKFLSEKVEYTSLIPLGKNIYVNGKITYTGEYFLDKLAFPNSYSVVETRDNTILFLENKIKAQEDTLQKSLANKTQIEERIKLLKGNDSNDNDNDALPREIISDKGVAVKFGDYYEIMEFED